MTNHFTREVSSSAFMQSLCEAAVDAKLAKAGVQTQGECEHCCGLGKILVYGSEESWEESCVHCTTHPQAGEPAPSTAVEPDFDPRTDCEKNYHECEDLKICGDCGRCMGA